MSEDKKTILSGIQPSGEFTIGNYFGAIKNWVERQDDYNCIYFIADMHAITVNQVPAMLRKRSFECAAMLLASGIDPNKSLLFVQSHVHQHAELGWILNCFSHMGELSRMTQYKDKSKNQGDNIKVGLFDYPVLMAADILLYQAELVPVGDDQKQHLELTRTIANRFNNTFSPTFKLPDGYYGENGARIMSLQDPNKKMSKSDENKNGFISMIDKKDVIMAKCKRAVTDSDTQIIYDKENKPGVSNLLEIYSCATNKTIEDAVRDFEGKNYAYLKTAVGESVADRLTPIQDEFERLCKEKTYVNEVLQKSEEQASYIANKTLRKVKKKVGFYSL